jgi:hypothetical protein
MYETVIIITNGCLVAGIFLILRANAKLLKNIKELNMRLKLTSMENNTLIKALDYMTKLYLNKK